MSKLIVVLGVSGKQGGSVARQFCKDPLWKVRGVSRHPASASNREHIANGAEIVEGDFGNKDSLVAAFQGAHAIFASTDFWTIFRDPANASKPAPGQTLNEWAYDLEVQQGQNIVDAAASVVNTLELFIWSTLAPARKISNGQWSWVFHFDSRAAVEEYIKEKQPVLSGKTSYFLPGTFVSNFNHLWKPAIQPDGSYVLTVPGPLSIPQYWFDAARDTGVCVEALTKSPPETKLLCYSDRCTVDEAVKIWGEVKGVKARLEHRPFEEWALDWPDKDFRREIGEMMMWLGEYDYAEPKKDPMLVHSNEKAIANLRAFASPPTNYYKCPLTRRAAVLILLFADRKGDLRVVLTIRSAGLRNYAGQAALPGGKADTLQETPFMTARREAFEEIGLGMNNSELPAGYELEHLAELPANLAMTELGVRPCVAYLKTPLPTAQNKDPDAARDLLPKLDAKEVAAVFTAPFYNFLREKDLDPEARKTVPGEWYKGSWHSWHETAWRMHQFFVPVYRSTVFHADHKPRSARTADERPPETTGANMPVASGKGKTLPGDALAQPRYRVFGMTARILVDAARVAYGEEPEFEHNSHFGDEEMMDRLLKIGRLSPKKKEGEILTRDVMMEAAKAKI
ncbi:8-oxo-dGTP diphosphatase [Elasticomyces elasticus]|nr:8-oxo-dGTP diphosphatase [Elasticomyces elasticus]